MKRLLFGTLASILLIGNFAFASVSPIGSIVTAEEPVIVQKMDYKPSWTGTIIVTVKN